MNGVVGSFAKGSLSFVKAARSFTYSCHILVSRFGVTRSQHLLSHLIWCSSATSYFYREVRYNPAKVNPDKPILTVHFDRG